jgi:hypothetical protein
VSKQYMRISFWALGLGLLFSARLFATDVYCPTPKRVSMSCQWGSCRGQVWTYQGVMPWQTVLTVADTGVTELCCGAQVPVKSIWYCPGPQPARLTRVELDQIGRTFGYDRVFLRTCGGGYLTLAVTDLVQGERIIPGL